MRRGTSPGDVKAAEREEEKRQKAAAQKSYGELFAEQKSSGAKPAKGKRPVMAMTPAEKRLADQAVGKAPVFDGAGEVRGIIDQAKRDRQGSIRQAPKVSPAERRVMDDRTRYALAKGESERQTDRAGFVQPPARATSVDDFVRRVLPGSIGTTMTNSVAALRTMKPVVGSQLNEVSAGARLRDTYREQGRFDEANAVNRDVAGREVDMVTGMLPFGDALAAGLKAPAGKGYRAVGSTLANRFLTDPASFALDALDVATGPVGEVAAAGLAKSRAARAVGKATTPTPATRTAPIRRRPQLSPALNSGIPIDELGRVVESFLPGKFNVQTPAMSASDLINASANRIQAKGEPWLKKLAEKYGTDVLRPEVRIDKMPADQRKRFAGRSPADVPVAARGDMTPNQPDGSYRTLLTPTGWDRQGIGKTAEVVPGQRRFFGESGALGSYARINRNAPDGRVPVLSSDLAGLTRDLKRGELAGTPDRLITVGAREQVASNLEYSRQYVSALRRLMESDPTGQTSAKLNTRMRRQMLDLSERSRLRVLAKLRHDLGNPNIPDDEILSGRALKPAADGSIRPPKWAFQDVEIPDGDMLAFWEKNAPALSFGSRSDFWKAFGKDRAAKRAGLPTWLEIADSVTDPAFAGLPDSRWVAATARIDPSGQPVRPAELGLRAPMSYPYALTGPDRAALLPYTVNGTDLFNVGSSTKPSVVNKTGMDFDRSRPGIDLSPEYLDELFGGNRGTRTRVGGSGGNNPAIGGVVAPGGPDGLLGGVGGGGGRLPVGNGGDRLPDLAGDALAGLDPSGRRGGGRPDLVGTGEPLPGGVPGAGGPAGSVVGAVSDADRRLNFDRWSGGAPLVPNGKAARYNFQTGQPVVVEAHHGSPDVRGVFAEGFKPRFKGDAFWGADAYATANSYANDSRAFDYQNAEPQTIPVFVRFTNPMVVDAGGQPWRGTAKFVAEARAGGHDGLIIKNSIDDYNTTKKTKPTTVYAWFGPEQVKSRVEGQLRSRVDGQPIASATGNRGTFDESPIITASGLGGVPDAIKSILKNRREYRDFDFFDRFASPLSVTTPDNRTLRVGSYERVAGPIGRSVSETMREFQRAVDAGGNAADLVPQYEQVLSPMLDDLRAGRGTPTGKPMPGLAEEIENHLRDIAEEPKPYEAAYGRWANSISGGKIDRPELALRTQVAKIMSLQNTLRLRFNIRSAGVNLLQPLETLWPYVNTRDYARLYADYTRPSTRDRLVRLGVLDSDKLGPKAPGQTVPTEPQRFATLRDPFGSASAVNRGVGYLYGELDAKRAGITDPEQIHRNGMAWAEVVEFDNSQFNAPPFLRDTAAGLVFQYKGFTIKSLEGLFSERSIFRDNVKDGRSPTPAQRAGRVGKYVTAKVGAGGLKSVSAGSALAFGAYLVIRQQLQDRGMSEDDAEKWARAVYLGAPSLIGADVSGSTAVLDPPFGGTPEEQLVNFAGGPTVGSAINIGKAIGKNAASRDVGQMGYDIAKTMSTPAVRAMEGASQMIGMARGSAPTMKIDGQDSPVTLGEAMLKTAGSTLARQTMSGERRESADAIRADLVGMLVEEWRRESGDTDRVSEGRVRSKLEGRLRGVTDIKQLREMADEVRKRRPAMPQLRIPTRLVAPPPTETPGMMDLLMRQLGTSRG